MKQPEISTAGGASFPASPVRLFIVVWDDEQGLCVPMVWDSECEGAICGGIGAKDRVALFTDRKAARKAIDISAKWAALNKAQGKVANDDFLGDCRKCLRVVECKPNDQGHESPPSTKL
jgi:hypothetical protein